MRYALEKFIGYLTLAGFFAHIYREITYIVIALHVLFGLLALALGATWVGTGLLIVGIIAFALPQLGKLASD